MEMRGIFQNLRFIRAALLAGGLTCLYLLFNIFVIGGDEVHLIVTDIITPVAALSASLLSFFVLSALKDRASRALWMGMALGFGCWGIADTIWSFYEIGLQQTIPFPSIADIFFTLAFIPLYFALITRLRTLRVSSTPQQKLTIAAISLAGLLLTGVFLLRPILAEFNSATLLEGFLDLFYPLGDLGLVILASQLLILLKEGRFAISWRFILSGILVMTFSDLIFSYATWQGLYFPEGHVNSITLLADTTYLLAYITFSFGSYLYGLVLENKVAFAIDVKTKPLSLFYAFVGTNKEDEIITVSDNFDCLVNGSRKPSFQRQPLAQVLGIGKAKASALVAQITAEGILRNELLTITTVDGKTREVWLTAVALYDPDHRFNGANLALSADLSTSPEQRLPQNREVLGMLNYLIQLAGSRPKDEIHAIRLYFQEMIRLLTSLLFQFGGNLFVKALFTELEQVRQQKNLPVELDNQVIRIPEGYEPERLAHNLRPLLQSARTYVAGLVGEQIVADEIREFEQQLSGTIRKDVGKYGLSVNTL